MELNTEIDGTGFPLVFLHGLFGSWENWGSQMRRLREQFRVVGIDLRNHGKSPHSTDMSYSTMAEDVRQTLTAHHITDCHMLGHSMGGKVAMALVNQLASNRADPAINQLIIVDIAPRYYAPHHESILKALNTLNVSSLQSRKDADNVLKPDIPEDAVRSFLLKNLVRRSDNTFHWKLNLEAISQQYPVLLEAPALRQRFAGQVKVIRGSHSDYVRTTDNALFDDRFDHWTLATIEGAGHWPHATHADSVHQTIVDFLTDD